MSTKSNKIMKGLTFAVSEEVWMEFKIMCVKNKESISKGFSRILEEVVMKNKGATFKKELENPEPEPKQEEEESEPLSL